MAGDARSVIAVTRSQNTGQCALCFLSVLVTRRDFHRYIIQAATGDHTGQLWLSGFNDVGITLFGMTGNELRNLQVSLLLRIIW